MAIGCIKMGYYCEKIGEIISWEQGFFVDILLHENKAITEKVTS
jgi:hypothetical protein